MSEEQPPGVLGGLPRSRPHRRSAKRPARVEQAASAAPAPVAPKPAARAKPKPKPKSAAVGPKAAKRATPTPSPPPPERQPAVLGTAVQAAAELAEIGLMASARALRGALSRLPRP
jgi:hypothetical protein